MMNRILMLLATGMVVASLPLAACANDTELTYGGTPHALNGNTTVAMKSEYVKMVVGEGLTTVDCRFTFENHGAARRVRMGFPDEGGEPGEDINPKTGNPFPSRPSITDFRSWVNGKPVKTAIVPVDATGSFWHVKQVDFPANTTLQVRDHYTVPIGNSVAYYPLSVRLARYTLHTGASWHGAIGRSEVEVVLKRSGLRAPLIVRRLPDNTNGFIKHAATGKRVIYYRGPCAPAISGTTLTFIRNNWRPTQHDDIYLVFDLRRMRPAR